MLIPLAAVIRRDLRLALRQPGDLVAVVGFFVVTAALFPLGVGPAPETLARISAGIIWAAALLAAMLALERLFLIDFEDGSLDLFAAGPVPLAALAAAKTIAHWLVTGLPIILIAPLLGVLLHLPPAGFPALIAGLLLGTPILSLVGAIGAGLLLGSRRGGILLALIVLPLCLPVLIFAVGAVDAAVQGITIRAPMTLLAGLLLAALVLAPLAAGAALRQAVE